MQEMVCRSCGANLHADDINIAAGIAKCRHCGAVFTFGNFGGGGGHADAAPKQRVREEIKKPSGFAIEEDAYRFRITQRWLSWKIIPLAIFAAFWDGFLVFWYFTAIKQIIDGEQVAWAMVLFPILHLIIGIAITYGVITTLVNTTTIDVDDRELRVRHGPLPVPGNKTLPSLDVKQLYCKERVSRNKNGTSVTYALHVKLKGGKDEKLLTNLTQQSHALYVEQQVERVLGLQDEAVAGETI